MSTFHGLEMAKQALFAQRSALNTTGHNISNVNTKGYSRQRVNFEAATPHPVPGMNRPGITGQIGSGVETGTIERIRNKFLDLQYRAENSKSGFWESKSEALHRLEQLMNEPSDSGISHTMNEFWESLQDLSTNPGNTGAKSVVAQRAESFTRTLNYTAESIESQRNTIKEIIGNADDKKSLTYKVNDLVDKINELNEQIKQVEVDGNLPNDLYDKRDSFIDDLSNIVNVKVSYSESSDSSSAVADGLATIELADSHGKALADQILLLDGKNGDIQKFDVSSIEDKGVITIGEGDSMQSFSIDEWSDMTGSLGSLMGHIDSYGYMKDILHNLDTTVEKFASDFNREYERHIVDDDYSPFFKGDKLDAKSIKVNEDILHNPDSIVASDEGYGDVASDLADVFEGDNSFNSNFESLIGKLGADAEEANRMTDNIKALRSQVESKRLSVSEVSLDEEMSNMIKFQHAYNAAARSMTTTDEMLDRIINNMGLVGR